METLSFTVPPEAAGKRIYFKAKVDSTDEVKETNEHDNWSDYEWYPVPGNCDLTISNAQVTGGRTSLREGDRYGFEMWVTNVGTTACPKDTQSGYYHKKPGGDFVRVTDDHTEAHLLLPGQNNHELTLNEPFTADTPGTHELKVCANIDNSNIDTNSANNCKIIDFEVTTYHPDFIVTQLGLKEGTIIKKGSYVHPYCVIKNIGNAPSPKDIRSAYYIDGDRRTDDGTKASELCVGCEKKEEVLGDIIKLGDKGTRTLTCCADYKNEVAELNESNNCRSMTFTVK